MDWLQLLFALHLYAVADLPPEYGAMIYDAAEEERIDPYDLAAVLISEKSGRDRDFSIEASFRRSYSFEWDPLAHGDDDERGLAQLKPRHAKKAGFVADQLWEPWPNIRTAAAVVAVNQESHETCESRRFNWHRWIAHYKCGPASRDGIDTRCYWSQRKWLYVRTSLVSIRSPDFKAMAKQERKTLNEKLERAGEDVGM